MWLAGVLIPNQDTIDLGVRLIDARAILPAHTIADIVAVVTTAWSFMILGPGTAVQGTSICGGSKNP